MALDKLVDSTQLDSDLEDVADAIRAKSGGSSQLAFPAGFVSEIGSIPTGGGISTEYTYLDTFNITEDVHQLTIDISSYDYGEYLLSINATGTGADYIYFSIASSGNGYFGYIQGNTYTKTMLISVRRPGTFGESGSLTYYYVGGMFTSNSSTLIASQSQSTKPSIIRIFA